MEVFTLQRKFLILSGFARSDIITRTRGFIQFLSFFTITVNLIFESYFVYLNHKDILVSAECFGPLSTEIIHIVKLTIVFTSKKKFYYLIDEIEKMATEVSEDHKILLKTVNNWDKVFASVLVTSGSIAGFSITMGPMILNLIQMALFGNEYIRETPIKIAFPFEWGTTSPAFELVAANLDYSCYITVLIGLTVDTIFFGCCLNISAHFKLLRESFDGDKTKFIKRHQSILSLAQELNELYKPIIFIQFLVSSISLCVLGFQLVMYDDFVKRIITLFFAFTIVVEVFLYSFGGQIVQDSSLAVADHFYETDKDLILIIQRSQKAVKIESFIYEADLPTFRKILSSAASLITFMKSFLE